MKRKCLLIICVLLLLLMPASCAEQAGDGYAGSTMGGIDWDAGLADEIPPRTARGQVSWQNPVCLPFRRSAYLAVQFVSSQEGSLTEYHLTVTDASGAVVAACDDTITGTRSSLNIWYDVLSDTGVALWENTSYKFQFWVRFDGLMYFSPVYSFTTAAPGQRRLGVDVSHHNGSIDWDAAAPYIDFAIIRCGYGSDMPSQDDRQWLRNVAECERLNIPYGVYLYSYALSEDGALSEAEHVLRLLQGHSPALPVYYDLEDTGTVATLPDSQIVRQTQIFMSRIEQAGFAAGVYSNDNWWTNRLQGLSVDPDRIWYAAWSCKYAQKARSFGLWQFTSGGNIPGIGAVDLNACPDYSAIAPEPAYAHLPADFVLPEAVLVIDSEAFRSCAFTAVRIPDGAVGIGSRAFADCVNLNQIEIPSSVTYIAENAFEGCSDVVFVCESGSAADTFAAAHGYRSVPFKE